jgi:ankyrin repeat protein
MDHNLDFVRSYVDELVDYVKHHITSTYGAYDMIPLQISAHLLSRLAAVQDVLKTNSGGTKLLHALQSAGAELSSIGPIMYAAREGRGETIRMLIGLGVDLEVRDTSGCSPAMIAAKSGHTICVRLLLDVGVNVDEWSLPVFAMLCGADRTINSGTTGNCIAERTAYK